MYRVFLLFAVFLIVVFFILYMIIRRLKRNIRDNIAELQAFFGGIAKILEEDEEMRKLLSDNNFDLNVPELSENMSFLDILETNSILIRKKSKLLKLLQMTKLENVDHVYLELYYKICRGCEDRGNSEKCNKCYLIRTHS